jgi:acetylornithine/N-succinyldiaminopimelate aminotransferase
MTALMPTYARSELAFERGEGSFLYTANGTAFLDYATGIAVNALGHGHPHIVAALKAQADKLWHVSNLYTIPEAERLAERLTALCFADKVFFTNSGAEALEGSFKTARRYQSVTGNPQRWRIISVTGAFHGRTLATLSATNNAKHLDGFGPRVDGFDQVPFGNTNALRAAITQETAGVVIEPIQGEGGLTAADENYLKALRATCDEFGLMLIFDEVQCGMGRSGKLFAHQWAGVEPDIMALAKGIGGGFPLGAFLASESAAQGMTPGTHGSTYGGGPLATAVGNAVLDVMTEPDFLEQVQATAVTLEAALAALQACHPDKIEALRGMGLIRGLRLTDSLPAGDMVVALRKEQVLTVPAGDNVVRVLPPLTTTAQEIALFCAAVDRVLSA